MDEHIEVPRVDENWERGLAVVAHPDDLEYGAASAIARWTAQGKEISYLLVTRGEAGIDGLEPAECATVRSQEEQKSAAVVGVQTVEFLDYPDGTVEYGLPLRRDIARVIRRHRPEVLISINPRLTWGNGYLNMADHRAVGQAVLDAARDAGNRWIHPELIEEGFEPWSGTHLVLFSASPEVTHAVDVTNSIDSGIASLREHQAYLRGLGGEFDPDTFLRDAAAAAGKSSGTQFATFFEVFHV